METEDSPRQVTKRLSMPRSNNDSPVQNEDSPHIAVNIKGFENIEEDEFDQLIDRRHSAITDHQARILLRWTKDGNVRRKAASRYSQKNRIFDDWLQLIMRVMAGFLGGTSILNLFRIDKDDGNYDFDVSVAVFSLIMLIAQSIDFVFKPGQKYENYRSTKLAYGRFVRSIRHHAASGIDDRPDKISEFISDKANEFNEIEGDSLDL